MKKLLLILALGLTFAAPVYGTAAGDDPVPWPFASRCPFPWKNIDGMWRVVDNQVTDSFEFEIVSTTQTGSRIMEVNRYDEQMNLIATGRGLSPAGQTVVRLAMYNVNPDSYPRSYTAFVGNYVEKDKFSCEHDRVHTVVTVRSYVSDKSQDSHYVIEKIKKNECTQTGQYAP